LNDKNIGLIIPGNHWEYPLFYEVYRKEINPISIKVPNVSKKINASSKKLEAPIIPEGAAIW